jgi:hypothetical protein
MKSLPRENEPAGGLRDIYSLIDTMLVEQGGSAGGFGVGRNSSSSPMSRVGSSRRMILPSSSSTCCSMATNSVYTNGTALCIFDDSTVDTFQRNCAWSQQEQQQQQQQQPLSRNAAAAVAPSEHSQWSEESCPWEANWAELTTLCSEASVVAPLGLPPPPLSSTSWPVPSLRHRPPPHNRPEAAADENDEMPTSLHHYFTWKPMYHKVEV